MKLTGGLISPTVNDQCYCVHSSSPKHEGELGLTGSTLHHLIVLMLLLVWSTCCRTPAVGGLIVCASLPMLPPVASVPSPPTHQPAPQHLGDEMALGRTGLAAETISAGQTMRPPEIIIDIMSEEIRGHTSLSIALVSVLVH